MIFVLVVLTAALATYFGYLFGVRRERGRHELFAELAEQPTAHRRGVRLRTIRVRR